MIHHLALTASDLDKSGKFYDAILSILGYRRTISSEDLLAWEGQEPEILLYAAEPDQVTNVHKTYDPGIHHVAFEVGSREIVDQIARMVAAEGGVLLDSPKAFPNYSSKYYATYFEDPDGIKIEVMTN